MSEFTFIEFGLIFFSIILLAEPLPFLVPIRILAANVLAVIGK
jgi:hypothetical protein